jgi:sec-independent protein translocase protein TatA
MTGFLTPTHILLLLLVALMLFGAKRLPELGRSLGSGMREFKNSIGGDPTPDQDAAGQLTPPRGAETPSAVSGVASPQAHAAPPPPAA